MALTKVPSNLDATIATTQSQADNSTNIATTAYVDLAISNLSDSAPAALNTLNEIAAALGDDANYASTTTAAIAAKLPLAGGTMTGNLTVNAIVDADNFKINNAQGTDGQLLTSTGSGVAWEDAPASGPTFKTFGTSSIMVGDSTTGTINAADYNTGLGVDVFANLTSGDQNTAIGFEAGNGITTQGQNTLIGYQAGKQVGNAAESWEAQRNTFIGFGAGRDVDEGQKAIAIGYYAMMSSTGSTTGDIAIGYQAMQYRASNSGDSIAIGSNAHRGDINQGYQNANRNVAIGNNALSVVETGAIQNTVVGWWAGYNVTTGPNNTLIGSEAGQAVSTGQLNTLLGYRAGELITTGNYNIVLGSYDGNEGGLDIRTASNRVVISDGAGNIRMYIDNTGNVGIGTTSPDKLLEVSGTDVIAKFTGTTANPPQIEFENSVSVQATIGLNTTHDFIIDTASENVYIGSDAATLGTRILTVLSTGLVGIGTPSPTDPLTIHHGTPGIAFKDTSSNGEAFWQLDGTQVKFVNKSSAGEMMFGTVNARRMSISQYGALHIDTASDYTGKQWLNENTAGSPLGGTSASTNTYQKLRLWVDGDVNLSQGRGIHFGDVTDAAPLCIREGSPSEHGTDRDKLEILARKQLTLTSNYSRIMPGDTSAAGAARSSSFYIKKDGQMGGTWTEVITTPNGGDQTTRVFEDWTGRWVMVGRFAADARTSIQGTWGSVSGLSTAVAQSTATAFSADWGDAYPSEVRIMGCTDVEEYMDTRTIDFVYGNRPSGVHSYTPRQWKHFFAGQNADGMLANAGGSPRFGFTVGYAYDGKGRWYNPNMHGMGMSDGNTTNPRAAYTTATANAFNWHGAADAKLLATHYRTFASQDSYQTTGFGSDDSVQGFYDSYPTEYTNMGGGTNGGGVHATLTSAVFILLKLQW